MRFPLCCPKLDIDYDHGINSPVRYCTVKVHKWVPFKEVHTKKGEVGEYPLLWPQFIERVGTGVVTNFTLTLDQN